MIFLAAISDVLLDAARLLFLMLGPFILFTVIIHWLENKIQTRLAGRFGWNSVMWTGWLGTPIHELSHAAMCVVFNHEIKDIALFEPDIESGRLGYVRHAYKRGNLYEEFGNVFIGIAPLLGGSLALLSLLWLFFPATISAIFQGGEDPDSMTAWTVMTNSIWVVFGELFRVENLLSVRFWVFVYLVLCVGAHMAPSRSDYQGVKRGSFLLAGLLVVMALVGALSGLAVDDALTNVLWVLSPLYGVFLLTIVLCAIATVVVHGFTSLFPQRYQRSG